MDNAQLVMEKRKHPRVTVTLPVKFKRLSRGEEARQALAEAREKQVSEATNVSAGGLALVTKAALRKHDLVKLELSLPNLASPVKAFAEVVWCREGGGDHHCGITFLALKQEDEDILGSFVMNLLGDSAG